VVRRQLERALELVDKGKAKVYQVKQVLKAIERMEIEHGTEKR
jgi:hypothetical protein